MEGLQRELNRVDASTYLLFIGAPELVLCCQCGLCGRLHALVGVGAGEDWDA